jgi:ubiquitin C-terminal hydrolase
MGFHCANCGPNCPGCPLSSKKISLSNLTKKVMLGIDWVEGAYNWDIEQDQSVAVAVAEDIERHQKIEIQDCLRELTKEEKVEMRCEQCGETDTTMKMEIWRTPDILILNLKRFFSQAGVAEKIDQMVDYPLYAFDISEFLPSTKPSLGLTMSTTALQSAYDLYSLVNHAGSMEGGHYTAFVLRKQEEDKWMLMDDDRLLEVVGDRDSVVRNKNAYLLFYRRRLLAGSNVINLTSPY